MKLEIGGGLKPKKPTYKQCDIRCLKNIDFCCNALDLKKHIEDNTVTHIYARHFFEHLTFDEGYQLLKIFYDILVIGGEVNLILPNITFHINQWINHRNDPTEFIHAKAGFWGWQIGGHTRQIEYDIHKSGYDDKSIIDLVQSIGYINCQVWNKTLDRDLDITFNK